MLLDLHYLIMRGVRSSRIYNCTHNVNLPPLGQPKLLSLSTQPSYMTRPNLSLYDLRPLQTFEFTDENSEIIPSSSSDSAYFCNIVDYNNEWFYIVQLLYYNMLVIITKRYIQNMQRRVYWDWHTKHTPTPLFND